jgi:tetratricopeptide (TPR) repeat protein
MSKQIKSLLQQAELYRTQGLLGEAKKKYKLVEELITGSNKLPNKEKLLQGLAKKMEALNKDVQVIEQAPTTPEMSAHVNELIKKLFSFSSKDKDESDSALEGAIALAKFGQFEGALEEFQKLLEVKSVRLSAAKNILRCHLEMGNIDMAKEKLEEWQRGELLAAEQKEKLVVFFDDILDKKGLKKEPEAEESVAETDAVEDAIEDEEEFLDISAVAITFDSGPYKGEQVELDVSFQSGNVISLIISSKDEALIENLKVGVRLDDIHFYSPVAIFRGAGLVSAMTQIKSGPKKGDYSLDIKIESL